MRFVFFLFCFSHLSFRYTFISNFSVWPISLNTNVRIIQIYNLPTLNRTERNKKKVERTHLKNNIDDENVLNFICSVKYDGWKKKLYNDTTCYYYTSTLLFIPYPIFMCSFKTARTRSIFFLIPPAILFLQLIYLRILCICTR